MTVPVRASVFLGPPPRVESRSPRGGAAPPNGEQGQHDEKGLTGATSSSERGGWRVVTWASGGCETDDPGVSLLPWGDDAWALVVPAGSTSKALYEVIAAMPAGLRFAESYGDVDVVLVYEAGDRRLSRREVPGEFLRAMLELDPVTVGAANGSRWTTDTEHQAYETGKSDFAKAMRRQITGWMPEEPAGSDAPRT